MKEDFNQLFAEYIEESQSFISTFNDRPDFFKKIGIVHFEEFTQLLEGYGFINDPTDHCSFSYFLDAEPFTYYVSLFGENLCFRLSYRAKSDSKVYSEYTDRFVNIIEKYGCLEALFFFLTFEIARLIIRRDNNEEDQLNLLRRRLPIKQSC